MSRQPASHLALLLTFWLAPLLVSAQGVVPAPEPAKDVFTISVTLAEQASLIGESIHFSGTLQNSDPKNAVHDVALIRILPSDYALTQLCTRPVGSASDLCNDRTTLPAALNDVPPGKSALWGTLVSQNRHAATTVSFVFQYKLNSAQSTLSVAAGSHAVQNTFEHFLAQNKDLAIPAAAAIFGLITGLFTWWLQHQDRRQEQERSIRAETYKLMLPESHRRASEFYIPIGSTTGGVKKAWDDFQKNVVDLARPAVPGEPPIANIQEAKTEELLFHLLRFGKVMRDMRMALGGFYFKNRVGERICARCWHEIRNHYYPTDDVAALKTYFNALTYLEDDEDVYSFSRKLANDYSSAYEAFHQAKAQVALLVGEPDRASAAVQRLALLGKVAVYEANRAYEYWYVKPREYLELSDAETKIVCDYYPDFENDPERMDLEQYLQQARRP